MPRGQEREGSAVLRERVGDLGRCGVLGGDERSYCERSCGVRGAEGWAGGYRKVALENW